MAFHVGQRVECVKEDSSPTFLRKGQQYTVSELIGGAGVNVAEIDLRGTLWSGFKNSYFRPIVQRKTSISIFTAMLNPSKTEVTA